MPPPRYAPDKKYIYSISLNKYKKINIYISLVSISYNIRDTIHNAS